MMSQLPTKSSVKAHQWNSAPDTKWPWPSERSKEERANFGFVVICFCSIGLVQTNFLKGSSSGYYSALWPERADLHIIFSLNTSKVHRWHKHYSGPKVPSELLLLIFALIKCSEILVIISKNWKPMSTSSFWKQKLKRIALYKFQIGFTFTTYSLNA